jgi:uncharacterized protein (DUF1778 family)
MSAAAEPQRDAVVRKDTWNCKASTWWWFRWPGSPPTRPSIGERRVTHLDVYGEMPYIVKGSNWSVGMPEQRINRTARLEARIAPEALDVVRRAAEIQGRSVSDFVVAAAQEAAQKTVSEVEVIRLSREAQKQFVELLMRPPKLNPALKKAFARHRNLIGK